MIEFSRDGRCGRGILLETPAHGVVGIVECAAPGCAWRFVLTVDKGHADPERSSEAIDRFLTTHRCGQEPTFELDVASMRREHDSHIHLVVDCPFCNGSIT
jgi:hypothetical protein